MIPFWPVLGGPEARSRVAYVCDGESVSYALLDTRARSLARRLYAAGARGGLPVATLLPNGTAFVEVLHATMRLGAVLMPLHPRLAPAELASQLTATPPALLLHDDRYAATAAGLPARRILHLGDLPDELDYPEPPRGLALAHSILHTSGSTGPSRAVSLSYGNHLWSALASAAVLGVLPADRWLDCLTPAHVGGLAILLRSALYGTTAVVHDGFDPERVRSAIDREGVTVVSLVAAMLERLLAEHGDRPFPPTLRCVLLGGGPAPSVLLERAARHGVPVALTYGLTEAASQVATRAPERDPSSGCGKPLPGTEVRIASDGEIVVRGPTVSAGAADADGWLHTGDLGHLAPDGGLHVDGRRDDLIVSGGENVHPVEVEAVLADHAGVAEAAVAGVPDGAMGQAVVAWVRLRPGARTSGEELRAHVRARLAGFKVPRRVHFVAELPRTPVGKIARRALREPA